MQLCGQFGFLVLNGGGSIGYKSIEFRNWNQALGVNHSISEFDNLIVGSGINSLVCAALLAKAGQSVCILERNDYVGGCLATGEITEPGFRHDLLASWHPLFVTSAAYAELKEELEEFGLEYCNTEYPAAGLTSRGESFIFATSRETNKKSLGIEEGLKYEAVMQQIEDHAALIFPILSQQLWTFGTLRVLLKQLWKLKPARVFVFLKNCLGTSRDWLAASSTNAAYHACIAPWVLHIGLGPESTLSAIMNKVIVFTLESAGMPVVKGGGDNLVQAFVGVIEKYGGKILANAEVKEIILQRGRAVGVKVNDADRYYAKGNVICNVTPQQLYGQLLPSKQVSAQLKEQAANYRYGRADMQIHIAMDEPPQWQNSRLEKVALIHICDSLNALSQAVNEADRGLLPATGTIVVGQPCAVDSSRAPEGKWILWIQLQELPRVIRGDAAGKIEVPEDGSWNDQVAQEYADRIVRRLSLHISNLEKATLSMAVLSPADLAAMNINLVGGDPYSGDCALDQNLLFRPTSLLKNHNTPVANVYHIGASTHPGPGLSGGSGYLVARQLR